LESIPANPLIGQEITLNKVTLTDSTGKVLPSSTNTNLTTTAGGTFKTATLSNIISAKVSDFPVKTTPTKEGTVTVTMDPNDPAYSAACASSVTVSKPVAGVCTELKYFLGTPYGTAPKVLEKNSIYTLSSTLTATGSDNKVIYSIDPNYGQFVTSSVPGFPVSQILEDLKNKNQLTKDSLNSMLVLTTSPSIQVPNDATVVTFYTYSQPLKNDTGLIPIIINIRGKGFSNPECTKYIPFNNPATALECVSITVTPNGIDFDPTYDKFIPFTIGGNFKDHNGEIRVSIKSSGGQGSKPAIKRVDSSQSIDNGYITFTSEEVKE
jgi:hypothetical protein